MFHGKGGYDWHTVYNMPIWLRRFTFSKIQDFFNQQADKQEEVPNKAKERNIKTPTFRTKASN